MNYDDEKDLEESFTKDIKNKCDGIAIKFLSTVSGLPDRLVLLPSGRAFFVEFKSKGQDLRKLQKYWRRVLTELGFTYYTVDSYVSYQSALNYAISGR